MVNFIVGISQPWMAVSERTITAVPLKKRIVIALFHLRNMCTATTTGRVFGVSNQLVSDIVDKFIKCFSKKLFVNKFITFPDIHEARELAAKNVEYGDSRCNPTGRWLLAWMSCI